MSHASHRPHTRFMGGRRATVGELFNNSGSIEAIDFFSSLKRLSRHIFKADGTDDAPEGLMCVGQNVRTV